MHLSVRHSLGDPPGYRQAPQASMLLHPRALIACCAPSLAQDSADWRYRSRVAERRVAIGARRRPGHERPGTTGRERTGSRIVRMSKRVHVAARWFGSGGRLSRFPVERAGSAIPAAILCRDGCSFRAGSPESFLCPRQAASRMRGDREVGTGLPIHSAGGASGQQSRS